jgi:hypothetical protein
VKQLSGLDWSNVPRRDSDECNRVTATIDKLDLVSLAVLVDMNDGTYITTIQYFVWRITIQNDQRVFGYHRVSSG